MVDLSLRDVEPGGLTARWTGRLIPAISRIFSQPMRVEFSIYCTSERCAKKSVTKRSPQQVWGFSKAFRLELYIYIISLKYRFITCGCLGKEDFPLFPTSSHLFPASITSVSLFQFFDRVIENILVSHLTCFQLVLPFLSVCPLCLRSCGCLGTKKCFCSRTSFPSCPLLVTKGSSWSILGIWVWVYGLLELQRSNVNS